MIGGEEEGGIKLYKYTIIDPTPLPYPLGTRIINVFSGMKMILLPFISIYMNKTNYCRKKNGNIRICLHPFYSLIFK
jgi:hypothetical protein